jgi:flagellar protein FliS
MNPRSAIDTYKRDSIETAPPLKLLRLLYQGAIRFLDRAAQEDPLAPYSTFVESLYRADSIVSELRVALRKDAAPQVADQLEQLYLFCEREIQRALHSRDKSGLPAVRQVLANLLEAWSEVELREKQSG